MLNAGDQVPEKPLVDTVGIAVVVFPAQIGLIGVNVGGVFCMMVIVNEAVVAH